MSFFISFLELVFILFYICFLQSSFGLMTGVFVFVFSFVLIWRFCSCSSPLNLTCSIIIIIQSRALIHSYREIVPLLPSFPWQLSSPPPKLTSPQNSWIFFVIKMTKDIVLRHDWVNSKWPNTASLWPIAFATMRFANFNQSCYTKRSLGYQNK